MERLADRMVDCLQREHLQLAGTFIRRLQNQYALPKHQLNHPELWKFNCFRMNATDALFFIIIDYIIWCVCLVVLCTSVSW